MTAITVNLNPIIQLSDQQFYQLCRENPDVKFERNAKGEILIMSPTGGETGKRNVEIAADFVFWNRQTKLGVCFDSSTCFKLPNGANRSPDVAWIKKRKMGRAHTRRTGKLSTHCPGFCFRINVT